MNKNLFRLFVLFVTTIVFIEPSFAGSMPWESGLSKIQASLTGPVAQAISIIGIVAAGGMLIFGGEVSQFMKSIIYLVLVICLIVGANTIFTAIGGTSSKGALITTTYDVQNPNTLVINQAV